MAKLNSFRELRVYQELRRLHLAVNEESLRFPKFEMLERLYERLSEWRGTTRTGYEVREDSNNYGAYGHAGEWAALVKLTEEVMDEFPPSTLHLPPSTCNRVQ